MQLTGEIRQLSVDYSDKKTVLTLKINEDALQALEELKNAEKLDFKITKHKEKRSLDANAYFWVLIGKIAKKLKIKSKDDVYREYIRQTGAYTIVPVRKDAIEQWTKIWTSKGEGWVVEDLGECRKIDGYHNMKSYYGSSMYDKEEMAHIIDLVVQDCKQLGIETMTPDELNALKAAWEE